MCTYGGMLVDGQMDRQTDRQTHGLITILHSPIGGGVTSTSKMDSYVQFTACTTHKSIPSDDHTTDCMLMCAMSSTLAKTAL